MKKLFTSESVTEGHPDKICDLISDSVLDALLAQDPEARVACETCATTGFVLVMGEVTTSGYVDVERVAREAIAEIGYLDSELGFDAKSCAVQVALHSQSPDIAMGVDRALEARETAHDAADEVGAGDQGMVFGYATDETESLMPLPVSLAHALTARLTEVRKRGILSYLRPDGKAQVTVEYEGDVPVRVDTVLVSAQHDPGVDPERLSADIVEQVVKPVVAARWLDGRTRYLVNPTGAFVVGGPMGDSGLTGRKIIVDTYGGSCPHGGGAFSGKDPTKVDRSACYMARYACKNLVAAGLARRAQLQLGYAIGVARPVSVNVETFGTGRLPDGRLAEILLETFDFRPRAIIDALDLRRPIYRRTTNYGHFGKADLPWERLDRVGTLRAYLPAAPSIASFAVDHTRLMPGFYLSRIDGDCFTYDLRAAAPNRETIPPAVLHSVEHLLAAALRNGPARTRVVYFGPMGCRTGFYFVARNLPYGEAKAVLEAALDRAAAAAVLPGATERECGNAREHDLAGAQALITAYRRLLAQRERFDYPG